MKQYDENCFGIDYHVLEYDADDLVRNVPSVSVLNEILRCTLEYKFFKVVDKSLGEKIDYYKDGMKHNEYGPSTIVDDTPKSFHIEDKKLEKNEFSGWKRTNLIDKMLNENE